VTGHKFVHISRVRPHPANIRSDLGDLTELAASVKALGILQPIVVEPHPSAPGAFQVLAGHRRLAAAGCARLEQIPITIRFAARGEPEELMLVENCQRRDLGPMEKAGAMGALRGKGHTAARIAQRTGLAASTVSYYLSLLDLDAASQEKIRAGHLAAADAVAAVRIMRKSARSKAGIPPVGATWEPDHFTTGHPLARTARARCDAAGHTMRRRIGKIACGQCWERVIRQDEQPGGQALRSVS